MSTQSRGIRFLAIALVAWAAMYTWAYKSQEDRVEKVEKDLSVSAAKVDAFKSQIEEVTRRHDVLLTYVITLRESLSKTGYEVPLMPPMERESKSEDRIDNKENPL